MKNGQLAPRSRPPISHYCSLLVLSAWAILLYRLDAQSLWYDEGYCIFVAHLPLREIIHWTAREFTPPLYHSLLALWLPLTGWTEFAARFLSVWAGTLMIAVMIRLGHDLHSRFAGFLAGLLAGVSPFYVWHGQDTRMYTFQALWGLLGTLFLLRALKSPARRWLWAGLALADALALYTHTTSGFLLVFHALVILAVGILSRRPALLKRGGYPSPWPRWPGSPGCSTPGPFWGRTVVTGPGNSTGSSSSQARSGDS